MLYGTILFRFLYYVERELIKRVVVFVIIIIRHLKKSHSQKKRRAHAACSFFSFDDCMFLNSSYTYNFVNYCSI